MPAHKTMTTLKLIVACPLLLAMMTNTKAEERSALSRSPGGRKTQKDHTNSINPASGDRGGLLLRRLGGQQRAMEGRPGVDQAPSAHAPHQADDRGVRRPRADLGLARRHAGDHGAADRPGRRPRDRLLRLLLVLEQGPARSSTSDPLHTGLELVPEGQEQPPPEVLPAGGQPSRDSCSKARTSGQRPPRAGCRTSSTRSTSPWTASRW